MMTIEIGYVRPPTNEFIVAGTVFMAFRPVHWIIADSVDAQVLAVVSHDQPSCGKGDGCLGNRQELFQGRVHWNPANGRFLIPLGFLKREFRLRLPDA